jgi:flagellar protein FlbB
MMLPLVLVLLILAAYQLIPSLPIPRAFAAEGRAPRPLDDAASLELKRQQLVEREAALKAKEQALARLSATLDARVNELNAAKKGIESALVAKKKQDEDRYKKMIKIYKGLKADEAGNLLNKLEPKMVIEMLNQMDQKTAIKLIPFITQPRVLEWTRLNLAGK